MGLLQDASKTDCLLSIYAGFVLHAHCNQALWSLWALLFLESVKKSYGVLDVYVISWPIALSACKKSLFTWMLPHISPKAPINMSETSSKCFPWRLLDPHFINAELKRIIFSAQLAVFVVKDPMKLFWKHLFEMAFSLLQLCKTSLGSLFHKRMQWKLSKWMNFSCFFRNH